MAQNIFERVDENGEIQRIVVDPEVLALGYWGDPSEWKQIQEDEVEDGEL